jgi:hypothetical protein
MLNLSLQRVNLSGSKSWMIELISLNQSHFQPVHVLREIETQGGHQEFTRLEACAGRVSVAVEVGAERRDPANFTT